MKNNPLVSIHITAYNSQDYIEETLQSCLNQTYKNIEIVVSDDGSSDKTPEMLLRYQNNFPEIIKINLNLKNLGITKNSVSAPSTSTCDDGIPIQCSQATVTITVTPVNDSPIAIDDVATVVEDVELKVALASSNNLKKSS